MDRLCLIQGENKVPASQHLPVLPPEGPALASLGIAASHRPLQKCLDKLWERECSSISEIYSSSPFCLALIRESAQWLPSKGKMIRPDFILFVSIIWDWSLKDKYETSGQFLFPFCSATLPLGLCPEQFPGDPMGSPVLGGALLSHLSGCVPSKRIRKVCFAWVPGSSPHPHTCSSLHFPNQRWDSCTVDTSGGHARALCTMWSFSRAMTNAPHWHFLLFFVSFFFFF